MGELIGEQKGYMPIPSQLKAVELFGILSKLLRNLLQVSHQQSFCLPAVKNRGLS